MKKINLEFKKIKNIKVDFGGQTIQIIPKLTLDTIRNCVSNYLDKYFNAQKDYKGDYFGYEYNPLSAELVVLKIMCQDNTNINIDDVSSDDLFNYVKPLLKENISNYQDVFNICKELTEEKTKENNSLVGLLRKINKDNNKTEISDESVKKLLDTFDELKNTNVYKTLEK